MNERKAGPIFKIGATHMRTMIESDGSRRVHPGDLAQAFPRDGSGPKHENPEVQKWLAWMRAGTPEKSNTVSIKKIPTAVAALTLVSPQVAISEAVGPLRYCRLFDAMEAFGLSAQEGREFVEAGALQLSAERGDAPLSEMLIAASDLAAFMQRTGCSFAPSVRH